MREEIEISELIEKYLNNSMSVEETDAFEKRIASNESLAEQVNQERLINEAIYYANMAQLKNDIASDIKKIKYKPDTSFNKYITSGIIILLAGGATGYYLLNKQSELAPANKIEITKPIVESADSSSVTKNNQVKKQDNKVIPTKTNQHSAKNSGSSIQPLQTDTAVRHTSLDIKNSKENPPIELTSEKSTTTDSDISKYPLPETGSKSNNCNQVFDINTSPSCKDKNTGIIPIKSADKVEFLIELDNNTYADHSNGVIANIPAGKHELAIKYGDDCVHKKTVTVAETWCTLNASYSFNPDYNERWELLYHSGDRGSFVIFNNFGKEVYQGNFGNGPCYWNGSDAYGNMLPTGTYMAVISYIAGQKEKVELTIVR